MDNERMTPEMQVDWQAGRIAELEADRDRLRVLLVWAYRWVPAACDTAAESRDEVEAGRNMIDDEFSTALTGSGEDPDTAKLRAVMDWLDAQDRAYPVRIFVPLCGYEHDRINKELQFLGISRDRLSADISRLWCQQLREAIAALKGAGDA